MVTYVIAHAGGFRKVHLTKHEDKAGAIGWLEQTGVEWAGCVFERPEEIPYNGLSLSDVFFKITGDKIGAYVRAEKQQRVFNAVVDSCKSDDFTTKIGDFEMAEKEKPAKEKKEKVAKTPKAKEYPAGKVTDFKPVRDGSIRATLLGLGNGKLTVDEIATKIGSTRSNLRVTLNCLQRDCGIGHKTDEKERLTFLYPGSKTVADAIITEKPKPVKKEKKAKGEQPATAA